MNITIQTPEGTYIVPTEKYTQLLAWLNINAIKTTPSTHLKEIHQSQNINQQSILLNE